MGVFDFVHRPAQSNLPLPQLDGTTSAPFSPSIRNGLGNALRQQQMQAQRAETNKNLHDDEDFIDDDLQGSHVAPDDTRDPFQSSLPDTNSTNDFIPDTQTLPLVATKSVVRSASPVYDQTDHAHVIDGRTPIWVQQHGHGSEMQPRRPVDEDLRRKAAFNGKAQRGSVAQVHAHRAYNDQAATTPLSAVPFLEHRQNRPGFADTDTTSLTSSTQDDNVPAVVGHRRENAHDGHPSPVPRSERRQVSKHPQVARDKYQNDEDIYQQHHRQVQQYGDLSKQQSGTARRDGQRQDPETTRQTKSGPGSVQKAHGLKIVNKALMVPSAAPRKESPVRVEIGPMEDMSVNDSADAQRDTSMKGPTTPLLDTPEPPNHGEHASRGYAKTVHPSYTAHVAMDAESQGSRGTFHPADSNGQMQAKQVSTAQQYDAFGPKQMLGADRYISMDQAPDIEQVQSQAEADEASYDAGDEQEIDQQHSVVHLKRSHTDMSLDYDMDKLKKMKYSKLQHESFDHIPGQEPDELFTDMADMRFSEKMAAILHYQSQDRQTFLSSLSMQDWEEAGKWLLDGFARITEKLARSRQQRRDIARHYEAEVARRHERVRGGEQEVKTILEDMKESGKQVVKDTPRKKR